MVRALDRKLLRDLSLAKEQAATIALVVACGIATFVAARSTHDSLVATRARYYADAHFADVFAVLERAPAPLAARMADIPGVAEVETRLVHDVILDVPGSDTPTVGRMISLPADGPRLNRLHLRRGRAVDPARRDEIVLSEGFAAAHGLGPGDRLVAILNGRREVLHIVGIGLSPEYVFPIRGGDALPDDRSFALVWIGEPALTAAFDMEGAFNDVTLTLASHAALPSVLDAVDRLLAPWGGLGAHGRDEQTSNRFLEDEIAQQRGMATTVPAIFLAVAAFLLNMVLGRLVTAQREQIATLKALGYADRALAAHYLAMVGAIVLAGAGAGVVLGSWLGAAMTAQYTQFFRFPVLGFAVSPLTPVVATAVALLAGAVGAVSALRRVLRLAPAEAMRPPAPSSFRHSLLERLGLARGLSPRGRMVLRSISSRPMRFVLSVFGTAAALAIVVLGLCWRDAVDYMTTVQFALAERGDTTVAFTRPVTLRTVRELAHLPGVLEVEAYRTVPVQLRAGHRRYRTAVLGVPEDARLRRLLDAEARPVAVPPDGLLLTRQLADRLHLAPGDPVLVDVREGKRPQREVPVAGLVDDLVGLSAYMDRDALNRVLEEGDVVNAATLRLDARLAPALHARLKTLSGIATAAEKRTWLEVFERTTATFVLFFSLILTAFAVAIAVGVVYNTARVALQERAWELASLRVLGFTRGEVSALLLGEATAALLLALPVGAGLGWLAAWAVFSAHQVDTFRVPLVVSPRTYALAALVVLGAGVASALLVRRRIDHLDLVGVLKARD